MNTIKRYLKNVLLYWVAICVISGAIYGMHIRDCPNDRAFPVSDIFGLAVAWPALIGALMTAPYDRGAHCDH
jgi:hypothetical protein